MMLQTNLVLQRDLQKGIRAPRHFCTVAKVAGVLCYIADALYKCEVRLGLSSNNLSHTSESNMYSNHAYAPGILLKVSNHHCIVEETRGG